MKIVVVGAGAFGGWTALHLLRAGHQVTLIDAWGPGNSRSSSGDETRVIRGSYGPNAIYTRMVARSIPLWKENERRWGVKLLHQIGALWLSGEADDSWEKASLANIRDAGMPAEVIEPAQGRKRFPQLGWDGLGWGILEKDGGYLLARRACQAVMEGFVAENGAWLHARAEPGPISMRAMKSIHLEGRDALEADHFVFACGPWLGRLFPGVVGDLIVPTRQEVFYFGPAAGDTRFNDDSFPAWVDNSPKRCYGIPGNQWRGFKAADDTPGEPFDPTTGERSMSASGLRAMREYLAIRFPALRDAPLVESRVCQYEMSADGGLIADRHPECDNVWLAGGGSGHGFKFCPALGEHVAALVLGKSAVNPAFALARFAQNPARPRERK